MTGLLPYWILLIVIKCACFNKGFSQHLHNGLQVSDSGVGGGGSQVVLVRTLVPVLWNKVVAFKGIMSWDDRRLPEWSNKHFEEIIGAYTESTDFTFRTFKKTFITWHAPFKLHKLWNLWICWVFYEWKFMKTRELKRGRGPLARRCKGSTAGLGYLEVE